MPVSLTPVCRLLLQNKAQNIVLGSHAMPDKKSDIVANTINGLVPFLRGDIVYASAQPIMYAILFQAVKVDNIHSLSPDTSLHSDEKDAAASISQPFVLESFNLLPGAQVAVHRPPPE